MGKDGNITIGTFFILGLIFLAYVFTVRTCNHTREVQRDIESNQYWEIENYKSDTVYIPKYIEVIITESATPIQPKSITVYESLPTPTVYLDCRNDSLIHLIDSLGKTIVELDTKFITLFPSNPKLLYSLFSPDTIIMDLLLTSGEIEKQLYLVDYSNFSYGWQDGQFYVYPRSPDTKSTPLFSTSAWVNVGYSFLDKLPLISLDYVIEYRKFRLQPEISSTIQQNPELTIKAKLGYNLKNLHGNNKR